jgi:hypothetical protein
MLAYDAQFLYLAIRCGQPANPQTPSGNPQLPTPNPQLSTPSSQLPRTRDADLSDHDRVDLLLDLDRDFATYYRLSVDDRGCPGDACWGDSTWDPTWFIAAASEDGQWTAEAAIPLDQLTGRFPTHGSIWAIGIQRTVPGVGFQSWSTPADTRVIPEGFGYLIFE